MYNLLSDDELVATAIFRVLDNSVAHLAKRLESEEKLEDCWAGVLLLR
jgi:hypothetical protein